MLIPTKQERKVASHFSAEFSLENEHFWNSTKHWGLSYWFYSFLFQSRILTEAQRKQLTFKYVPEIPPILELKKKKSPHLSSKGFLLREKAGLFFSICYHGHLNKDSIFLLEPSSTAVGKKKKKKLPSAFKYVPLLARSYIHHKDHGDLNQAHLEQIPEKDLVSTEIF